MNILGATLQTFTPDDDQVGRNDSGNRVVHRRWGRQESVTSAASGVVGDLFNGGAANDVFNGTAGRDHVTGGGGNDTLTTLEQADQVQGGPGNDTINTGAGDDVAAGGAGDDTINTGAGNDSIRFNGADGFDAVNGGAGTDEIVVAGAGAVIGLQSLTGVETITGAGAGVNIVGSEAANTLNFSAVTLTLIDRIQGGGGADVITGNGGQSHRRWRARHAQWWGWPDDLNGGAGNDTSRRAAPTPSTAAPATTASPAAPATTP